VRGFAARFLKKTLKRTLKRIFLALLTSGLRYLVQVFEPRSPSSLQTTAEEEEEEEESRVHFVF
jgi:hypothetical protein